MSAPRGGVALWAAGAAALALAAAAAGAVIARGAPAPKASAESASPSGGRPRSFRNADGAETVVPAKPSRIVSLTLPGDEMLLALGLGERLLAVTEIAADAAESYAAEEAARFPKDRRIAATEGAAEKILGLRPDLVVAAPWNDAATLAHLGRAGIPVYRIGLGDTVASVDAALRSLGQAAGAEAAADRAADEMRRRIAAASARVAGRPPVRTVVLSYTGAEAWTGAAGTLLDEAIRLAGGVNAAAEGGARGYSPVSMERLLALQPEAIVLSSPNAEDSVVASFRARPGAGEIAAVRNGRLPVVPARCLTTTSQHAADAVEALARALHPDAFGGA